MESIREHIGDIVKACTQAEKAWTDHMNKPDYNLNRNYILYKKYIRLFNILQEIDKLEKDNPQASR